MVVHSVELHSERESEPCSRAALCAVDSCEVIVRGGGGQQTPDQSLPARTLICIRAKRYFEFAPMLQACDCLDVAAADRVLQAFVTITSDARVVRKQHVGTAGDLDDGRSDGAGITRRHFGVGDGCVTASTCTRDEQC